MRIRSIVMGALLSVSAHANTDVPNRFLVPFMEVAPAPAAREFCREYRQECRVRRGNEHFVFDASRRAELAEVDLAVNANYTYASDEDLYGVDEKWTLNARRGDCEDFAIWKRHLLLARGWPSSALLIAVVRTHEQTMHAVLVARTTEGDMVLDKAAVPTAVRPWYEYNYYFVAMQSPDDPQRWMSLIPPPLPVSDLQLGRWIASR